MKNTLAVEMIKYYCGDIKRINHFIKVHGFAKAIGEAEELDERTMLILETASYVHDIGIKISEEKYGSSNGHFQQLEGPPVAAELLERLGFDEDVTERVLYLIAHHHTYTNIDSLDYQILVEADFLVNLHEENADNDTIRSVREKIFKTETGKQLLDNLYTTEMKK